jgi:FkbM family methyltransferase
MFGYTSDDIHDAYPSNARCAERELGNPKRSPVHQQLHWRGRSSNIYRGRFTGYAPALQGVDSDLFKPCSRVPQGSPVTRVRPARWRIHEAARKTRKLGVLLTQSEWRRGLRSAVAATVEHDALPLRQDLRTVIDVGANRGQFTLYALARFPSAHVIAFEPLPGAREHMARLFEREDRVEVVPFALGDAEGELVMHLSAKEDSSSLLPVGERQVSAFPGTDEVGTTRVNVQTLDNVLAARELALPALLKVDVQGFELPVLRGAGQALQSFDQILIEASFIALYAGQALFPDISHCLEEQGFHLVSGHISTSDSSGRWLQGDFLYEKD